eukprot:TRINITY_DN777_c0_g1_i1.p1 TRINITY_DN777_c0_g1~~TRINITY_DN777_c0_g1_i1.p1  ORF type:complete len:354 (-),score=29.22 TRINITY_DN777_c0_g1_i1:21-1082(-)
MFAIFCTVLVVGLLIAVDWKRPWLLEYYNVKVVELHLNSTDLKWWSDIINKTDITFKVGGQAIDLGNNSTLWVFGETTYLSQNHLITIPSSAVFIRTNENNTVTSSYIVTNSTGDISTVIMLQTDEQDGIIIPSGGITSRDSIYLYWEVRKNATTKSVHYAYGGGKSEPDFETNPRFVRMYPDNTSVAVVPKASVLSKEKDYIYFFMLRGSDVVLSRVSVNDSLTQSSPQYAFWNGSMSAPGFFYMPLNSTPPVVKNVSTLSIDVMYNSYLKRYLMLLSHGLTFSIRVSANPWGNWEPSIDLYSLSSNQTDKNACIENASFHPELGNRTAVPLTYYLTGDLRPNFIRLNFSKR